MIYMHTYIFECVDTVFSYIKKPLRAAVFNFHVPHSPFCFHHLYINSHIKPQRVKTHSGLMLCESV